MGRANVHHLLARRLENQVDDNCMQIDRHVFALPSELTEISKPSLFHFSHHQFVVCPFGKQSRSIDFQPALEDTGLAKGE